MLDEPAPPSSALPLHQIFEPARTVKLGKPSYTIERRQQEAV